MATLYVDYKNGVDTNDGSSGAPLKTLAHCLASHANNGDTILLRGTNATDEIHRAVAVSSALTTITIAADTGHTPVVSGSVAYGSWSLTADQSFTYETAYTPSNCYMVWNGTTYFTSVASIAAVEATENTFYADLTGDKLYVHITGGGAPGTLEVHGGNVVLTLSGTNATVDGIIFEHGLRNLVCSGTNVTIRNCILRYSYHPTAGSSAGLSLTNSGPLVTGCTITVAMDGIGVWLNASAASATVRSCTLTHVGAATTTTNCGVLAAVGSAHLVEGCTISGFYDGTQATGAGTGLTARYNIIQNCSHGFMCWISGATGVEAHHNICYYTADWTDTNVAHHGIILHCGVNAYVYHNVVAWLNRRNTGHECGIHLSPQVDTTFHCKNNILYNCEYGISYGASTGSPAYDLGYNAFYGNAADFQNIDPGDQGTNNVTTDPLFVNPLNYDFRLLPGSPLIDVGMAVTGINEGFRGGAPDIGAFEYVRPLRHGRR